MTNFFTIIGVVATLIAGVVVFVAVAQQIQYSVSLWLENRRTRCPLCNGRGRVDP